MALHHPQPGWRRRDRQLRRVRGLIASAVWGYAGLVGIGTFTLLEGLKGQASAPLLLGCLLIAGGYAGMRLCATSLEGA